MIAAPLFIFSLCCVALVDGACRDSPNEAACVADKTAADGCACVWQTAAATGATSAAATIGSSIGSSSTTAEAAVSTTTAAAATTTTTGSTTSSSRQGMTPAATTTTTTNMMASGRTTTAAAAATTTTTAPLSTPSPTPIGPNSCSQVTNAFSCGLQKCNVTSATCAWLNNKCTCVPAGVISCAFFGVFTCLGGGSNACPSGYQCKFQGLSCVCEIDLNATLAPTPRPFSPPTVRGDGSTPAAPTRAMRKRADSGSCVESCSAPTATQKNGENLVTDGDAAAPLESWVVPVIASIAGLCVVVSLAVVIVCVLNRRRQHGAKPLPPTATPERASEGYGKLPQPKVYAYVEAPSIQADRPEYASAFPDDNNSSSQNLYASFE